MRELKVAVLIDGAFFLKRYFSLLPDKRKSVAQEIADDLHRIALEHVGPQDHLYRVYYYDCFPLMKKIHHPRSGRAIDLGKSSTTDFRMKFFDALKHKRKVALRIGHLKENGNWIIHSSLTKKLLQDEIRISDLKDDDVRLDIHQKGVDMKIGIDIATLAFKKLVDRIILIAGDADFVPASKLARFEGIDFVLDPIWNPIDEKLLEHVDGIHSVLEKPRRGKAA